jgi:hypothetical protein
VKLGSLPHSGKAIARPIPFDGPLTVVGDLDLDRSRPVADNDVHPRRTGVLDDVRERLLQDSVGRDIDAWREGCPLTFNLQLDGHAGIPQRLDQGVDLVETGPWRQRKPFALLAEDAEQPAHLRKGLPASAFDR